MAVIHSQRPTGLVALMCGDYYAIPSLDKRGGLGDVEQVWCGFKQISQTVIGVAGNHDRFGGKLKLDGFF